MAYIYQIINDINQKIYIGKTEFSIEKRFKEHCKDAFKDRNEKRPLYAAMQKHGIEHFHIDLIEETDNPNEREIYWIQEKGSFKNGYNATIGGDGKKYLDYDLIEATYNQVGTANKTAKILGINNKTVGNVLHSRGYSLDKNIQKSNLEIQKNYGKKCAMIDNKTEEIIKVFASFREAGRYIKELEISKDTDHGIGTHISQVCNGKRKTAYGYKWKLI